MFKIAIISLILVSCGSTSYTQEISSDQTCANGELIVHNEELELSTNAPHSRQVAEGEQPTPGSLNIPTCRNKQN